MLLSSPPPLARDPPSWAIVVALAVRELGEWRPPRRRALQLLEGGAFWPVRPVTRADCSSVPRPCPFLSCKYNLFLEVERKGGATMPVVRSVHDRAPWQVPPTESCVLDLVGDPADPTPVSQSDVARLLHLVPERVRQIEVAGKAALRAVVGLREMALGAGARARESFEDLRNVNAWGDSDGPRRTEAPERADTVGAWACEAAALARAGLPLAAAWQVASAIQEGATIMAKPKRWKGKRSNKAAKMSPPVRDQRAVQRATRELEKCPRCGKVPNAALKGGYCWPSKVWLKSNPKDAGAGPHESPEAAREKAPLSPEAARANAALAKKYPSKKAARTAREPVNTRHETRRLPIPVGPEVVDAAAHAMAALHGVSERLKTERREAMAEFKEQRASIDQRMGELADTVTRSTELADVPCTVRLYVETNEIDVVRDDTGEVIETRAASAEDRQADLDVQVAEVKATADAVTPWPATPESMAPEPGTLKGPAEAGLPIDPSGWDDEEDDENEPASEPQLPSDDQIPF